MRFTRALCGLIFLAACGDSPADPDKVDSQDAVKPYYAAGASSTCYIDATGDLYCLGFFTSVHFGTPTGPAPRKQNLPGKATAVSVYAGNACAIVNHHVYCRGNNDWGELGTGVVGPFESYQESYSAIQSTVAFDSIVVGNNVACAISTAGKAYCWGANRRGETGVGILSQTEATPKPVAGDFVFRAIAGGTGGGFCALETDGTPYCWGVFDPTLVTRPAPVKLQTNVKFQTVSLSSSNGCGVDSGGVLYCWGANLFGELGPDPFERKQAVVPEQMVTSLRFKSAVALSGAVCGIATDGIAHCRGNGLLGIYGNGQRRQAEPSFQDATTQARFVSISGTTNHVCAMTAANEVYCWGFNLYGMTGETPTGSGQDANTPIPRLLVDL